MDLWCVHAESSDFLLRNSFPEKPICWSSRNHSMAFEIRVSRGGSSSPSYCRYRSVLIRARGKKNPGNSSNPNSNSGNNDHLESGGDGVKGSNYNKSSDTNSRKSQRKPLDWREFRALLYIQEQMDVMNAVLNFLVPPASLLMLAFAWPTLFFISTCERLYKTYYDGEKMEDKVVVITGASSGIGEQIAYQYAKRGANLVLVARREQRLRGISENARMLGAPNVLIMAADVVKEDDCRRFINETINYYGRVDHLVNTVSLGHTFYFEEATDSSVFPILMDINFWGNVNPTYVALPYLRESNGRIIVNASVENWLPLPRMSLYSAAKSALMNFYETLRFEVKNAVGITVATHGWIGTEITGGKFMVEEGAEMQWKEEREVHISGGPVEEFARLIVEGACRGDPYVKYPSWYDVFFLYRVFAPKVLYWTFHFLLTNAGARRATSLIGTGRPLLEAGASGRRPLLEAATPPRSSQGSPAGSLQGSPPGSFYGSSGSYS